MPRAARRSSKPIRPIRRRSAGSTSTSRRGSRAESGIVPRASCRCSGRTSTNPSSAATSTSACRGWKTRRPAARSTPSPSPTSSFGNSSQGARRTRAGAPRLPAPPAAPRGGRVAPLGATIAYDLLERARDSVGVIPISYDDDVHPYADLVSGRVDAVLLDHIIAQRALRRAGGTAFVIVTTPVAIGHYVGVLARANAALRDSIDQALREAMRDGSLEQIFRRWNVWDDGEGALFERVLRGGQGTAAAATGPHGVAQVIAYLPSLARAAAVPLLASALSMLLAVVVGLALASARVYGRSAIGALATLYVEVVRGAPLLLQRFVIYYGLAGVVRLPAFLAAILALGLNYAAYEAEIYRGALEAVARVQLEAARTLGLSELQILRLGGGAQALGHPLGPMTNDFVALLKDSALVSVITVVELTKQTAIYATNIGSWVVPGALCALVYLAMSLPLARLARRLERRWSASSSSGSA